ARRPRCCAPAPAARERHALAGEAAPRPPRPHRPRDGPPAPDHDLRDRPRRRSQRPRHGLPAPLDAARGLRAPERRPARRPRRLPGPARRPLRADGVRDDARTRTDAPGARAGLRARARADARRAVAHVSVSFAEKMTVGTSASAGSTSRRTTSITVTTSD